MIDDFKGIARFRYGIVDLIDVIHDEAALIAIENQAMFAESGEHDEPLAFLMNDSFGVEAVVHPAGDLQDSCPSFIADALVSVQRKGNRCF